LRIATAFSGIGAPEQAARRVYPGHEIVFACEIDKFARQSYLANYNIDPEHFHSDVTKLDGIQYKGMVDLFVWGFPCQDYSIVGKRAGLEGQRGTLFYEGARLTKEIQPNYFIAENVKGLLSSNGGKDFEVIMDILRNDVGYYCTWAVLNTKDYGVPQNRERVFIVGFKNHDEYMRFEFPKPIKLEKSLKDILEDDVDEKYYLSQKMIACLEGRKTISKGYEFKPIKDGIAHCLTAKYGNYSTDTYIITPDGRIRKLTSRETLRLMDFPESFKQVVSDTQMYKQAGNSMSVNVVEALYHQIEKAKECKEIKTLLDLAS